MPEKKSKKKTASPSTTKSDYKTFVQTRTIDDVFTDAVDMVKPKFEADYRAYLERLWEANPDLQKCLQQAADLETARNVVFDYLEKTERAVSVLTTICISLKNQLSENLSGCLRAL